MIIFKIQNTVPLYIKWL